MANPFVRSVLPIILAGAFLPAFAACNSPKKELAPEAAPLAADKLATNESAPFDVAAAQSKVDFLLDAPLEQIKGRAPGALSGEVFLDPTDLSKTKGLVTVDLDKLVLYQEKRESKDAQFGAEQRSDVQNSHARAWLEIGEDAPADVRQANRFIEFRLAKVEPIGPGDVTKMTGPKRTLKAKVTGDFRLHGRVKPKTAELDVVFNYEGDALKSVSMKTVKPFSVDLDEFDIRPREAFGKLAQKTLAMLAPKVAREAHVNLEFSLTPQK